MRQADLHPRDAMFEGACPTCGGTLRARFTRSTVWAWCGTCLRLTRPLLLDGPSGPVLMHPAAAA